VLGNGILGKRFQEFFRIRRVGRGTCTDYKSAPTGFKEGAENDIFGKKILPER
jgi:hypothetical protein